MDVPASRYLPSSRRYNPAPKNPEYPSHSTVIKVDHLGRFRYRGLRLFASEALADELIRIEELESTAVIFYRNTPIREVSLVTGKSSQFVPSLQS
jgi:hypothetical protein